MIYGFTGTRDGATDAQKTSMRVYFDKHRATGFRHGCCKGADEDAVTIFAGVVPIYAHPPLVKSYLSGYAFSLSDVVLEAKEYLERNRDIVDLSAKLAACPKGPEELRSGTWSTIRYAAKVGKPCVIFWPDGRVEEVVNS